MKKVITLLVFSFVLVLCLVTTYAEDAAPLNDLNSDESSNHVVVNGDNNTIIIVNNQFKTDDRAEAPTTNSMEIDYKISPLLTITIEVKLYRLIRKKKNTHGK